MGQNKMLSEIHDACQKFLQGDVDPIFEIYQNNATLRTILIDFKDFLVAREAKQMADLKAKANQLTAPTVLDCPVAPGGKLLVDEKRIYLLADEDFVADALVETVAGFDATDHDGQRWYLLAWCQSHNWMSEKMVNALISWLEDAGVGNIDTGQTSVTWYLLEDDQDGTRPEFVRLIGMTQDGDVFISADSVSVPKGGMSARTIYNDGHEYISVDDWAKANPEGFAETILADVIDDLRNQRGIK